MDKEILEEVAENYKKTSVNKMAIEQIAFMNGAKWQQERMYSEEEVLQLLLRLQQTESYDNLYDWFEQFKKK